MNHIAGIQKSLVKGVRSHDIKTFFYFYKNVQLADCKIKYILYV
jgi:hypothetical protein